MDTKPWLGRYRIPTEALRLAEEVQTLSMILKLFDTLDTRTFGDDTTKRAVAAILTGAKRVMEEKLRHEYLNNKRVND